MSSSVEQKQKIETFMTQLDGLTDVIGKLSQENIIERDSEIYQKKADDLNKQAESIKNYLKAFHDYSDIEALLYERELFHKMRMDRIENGYINARSISYSTQQPVSYSTQQTTQQSVSYSPQQTTQPADTQPVDTKQNNIAPRILNKNTPNRPKLAPDLASDICSMITNRRRSINPDDS